MALSRSIMVVGVILAVLTFSLGPDLGRHGTRGGVVRAQEETNCNPGSAPNMCLLWTGSFQSSTTGLTGGVTLDVTKQVNGHFDLTAEGLPGGTVMGHGEVAMNNPPAADNQVSFAGDGTGPAAMVQHVSAHGTVMVMNGMATTGMFQYEVKYTTGMTDRGTVTLVHGTPTTAP